MTLEEYLSSAYYMNIHINDLLVEKEELEWLATSINCDMSKERVQTTGKVDKLPSVIAKIIDLERLIDRKIDAYVDRKEDVAMLIDGVDTELQKCILTSRYVLGMCWEDIANKFDYCEKQVKRIHNDGINAIKKKFPKKIEEIQKMSRNVLECPVKK